MLTQLYVASGNRLRLLGLHNQVLQPSAPNYFIVNATITAYIYTVANVLVTTVVLAYTGESFVVDGTTYQDGNYEGVMLATVSLIPTAEYNVLVEAIPNNGADIDHKLSLLVPLTANYAGATP